MPAPSLDQQALSLVANNPQPDKPEPGQYERQHLALVHDRREVERLDRMSREDLRKEVDTLASQLARTKSLALDDAENFKTDVAVKNRKIRQLERELKQEKGVGVPETDVDDLIAYWMEGRPKTTKCPRFGPRWTHMQKLVKDWGADRVRTALTGLKKYPYQLYDTRYPVDVPGSKKRDDVDALTKEKNFELLEILATRDPAKDAAAAQRLQGAEPVDLSRIWWGTVRRANQKAIEGKLRALYGDPLDDIGWLLWPCPYCKNEPASTLGVNQNDEGVLARCSECGRDETALIKSLRAADERDAKSVR